MTTELTITPSEKGTAIVKLSFTDEDGNTVIPYTLQWQLMRPSGTIVNDNFFANNDFEGTEIVLTCDDLKIFNSNDTGKRILSVQGYYDSSAGTGLCLKGECSFYIDKLVGQTDG